MAEASSAVKVGSVEFGPVFQTSSAADGVAPIILTVDKFNVLVGNNAVKAFCPIST
ncbi:hypothetical protein D3C87_1761310 [compost metagenome]